MRDLLEYLVRGLVSEPDAVRVGERVALGDFHQAREPLRAPEGVGALQDRQKGLGVELVRAREATASSS